MLLKLDFYKLSAQEVQAEHEAEQWIKSKGALEVLIWDYHTLTMART